MRRWLHGEGMGVGCGMVMAARLSERLGTVDEAFVQRLTQLIERAGLPIRAPALPMESCADVASRHLQLMQIDKKAEGGEIRFITIDPPRRATLQTVPNAVVRDVIAECMT